MVFSSLRSRNRHSANPNPRLHTGAARDSYPYRNGHSDTYALMPAHEDSQVHDLAPASDVRGERVTYDRQWQRNGDDAQLNAPRLNPAGHGLSTQIIREKCDRHAPPHTDPPLTSPGAAPRSPTTDTHHHPSFRCSQRPLPPTTFLAAGATPPLGSPDSFISPVEVPPKQPQPVLRPHPTQASPGSLHGLSTNAAEVSRDREIRDNKSDASARAGEARNSEEQWAYRDTAPKKKPRKSSMPVKIEREKVEGRANEEDEELF